MTFFHFLISILPTVYFKQLFMIIAKISAFFFYVSSTMMKKVSDQDARM